MNGSWVAKPLFALSDAEKILYRDLYVPGFPLSQTLEWGYALRDEVQVPFVVFSPERRVASLFTVSGTLAECVNGPVLDWSRIHSARELNEQVSMVVYALHKSNSGLRSIRIRPRLQEKEFVFLREHLAFPLDQVDEARSMILDLQETEDAQLRALPARIRNEISRSLRSGVRVVSRETSDGISDFWGFTREFYRERGLPLPEEEWIRGLLFGNRDWALKSKLISAFHEESGSQASLLLVWFGGVALYFFAHEIRTSSCPKISLNVCAQWEAMMACIRSGVRHYDLNGVLAPHEASKEAEPYRGVDFYKRKFKGREVEYRSPTICFGAP
ncbi:MAG: hypothetical protein KGP28_09955 [Bdellovibrionales bacterium]|nr:hypothetical protein [Bdellovibrionales bacterium]